MKNTKIWVGLTMVLVAVIMMPCVSALTITQEKFEPILGIDMETYTMAINEKTLYIIGVNEILKEIQIYSWNGIGTSAKKEATIDLEYDIIPTGATIFKNKLYITTLNKSAPSTEGIEDIWTTPLYAYDLAENELYVSAELSNGALTGITTYDTYLVILGDFNTVYYSTNGVTFSTKNISVKTGESDEYYYFYRNWNLGLAVNDDKLIVQSRNCSYREPKSFFASSELYYDKINFYYLENITDNFTAQATTLSPSRVTLYGGYNISSPMMTLGDKTIFSADYSLYYTTYNEDEYKLEFTRVYNGDASSNPAPLFAPSLTSSDSVYAITTEKDNTPSCPPFAGLSSIPKVIAPTTWHTILLNTKNGKVSETIKQNVANIYDIKNFKYGSIIYATTEGIFTFHSVPVNYDSAIMQLITALLIIGIILIAFGVLSWNKGFEDVLSLSAGITLISTSAILYVYPALYLSWLLVLLPVTLFFAILYAFIKTYHLELLDFRLASIDAMWIVIILAIILAIEVVTGYLSSTFTPSWLTTTP